MKALEEKILREGSVLPGNVLKVGDFLNQQIDVDFLTEMGKEIARLYKDSNVEKILTVEASGIAIAVSAAMELKVPVVFAKKSKSSNVSGECYTQPVMSYTHGMVNEITVSKKYLKENERILVIDDFLANGAAINGLLGMLEEAKATAVGVAVAIEKGFQKGGDKLRAKGIRIESLAIVDEMSEDKIVFRPQDN